MNLHPPHRPPARQPAHHLHLTRRTRLPLASRKAIIRIYFDEEPVPYVEAPAAGSRSARTT